jgi:Leucine rich repeat
MRIARFLLFLGSVFAVLAPVPALAQMVPARVISSIDSMVLNEESVAVGRITRARPANNDATDVTIAIDSVLKGAPQTTLERRQERGAGNRLSTEELSRLAVRNARVLIVGNGFTPLDGNGLAIPAANGNLLGEANQVVAHIQQVLRTHAPGWVGSFNIPLPQQFENATVPRFFDDGRPGPARELRVPVDLQLEAWALEAIRSNKELYRAFQALHSFKSASNIEFARGLFNDPTFDLIEAGSNNGVEVRIYRTREHAYKLLQDWSVAVDRPVLREEIPRFETLERFTWGLGPEDRFDKAAALSTNLKDLNISSSGHPSREQLAKIGNMRSLTRLRVNGSDKGEALRYIPNLVNLEELILWGVGITDNGLGPLLSLPNLKTLDLENNRITDVGLRSLAGIRTLKTLNVSRNSVTSRGIAEVSTLRPDLEIKQ